MTVLYLGNEFLSMKAATWFSTNIITQESRIPFKKKHHNLD